jgi:uncharacterized C2H2 Zn-finger protein
MAKRLNYESISKQHKIVKNGTSATWEDIPPKDHFVTLNEYRHIKSEERKKAKAKTPKVLANCPLCGQLVSRLKHHIQKAHGILAGHEHQPLNLNPDEKNQT